MALDHLNLSRGGLAQRVGVDKSAVARWAAGTTQPAETRLVAITHLVRHHVPDFSRSDWALPEPAFAARLGVSAAAVAPDAISGPLAATFARAAAARSEGLRYTGLWAVLYASMQSAAGRPQIFGTAMEIFEGTTGFHCLMGDGRSGVWTAEGLALPLGGKLYLLAGREPDLDALTVYQFWGVPSGMPVVLDGLCMARAGNLMAAPTASYSIAFRLADAAADEAAARRRWASAAEHMTVLCQSGFNAVLPEGILPLFRRDPPHPELAESRRLAVPVTSSVASDERNALLLAAPDHPLRVGLETLRALFDVALAGR